jgi:DNA polymerase-3 subunit epsilon
LFRVQLSFDAADRLVDLVEARGGRMPADQAARELFALASAPVALARSLLDDVVRGDARLAWRGDHVAVPTSRALDLPIEEAELVVFDLETTGLSPTMSRICEIGAQRVRAFTCTDSFTTLVNPRVPLPAAVQALTGIVPAALRGAPPAELAVRRFLEFAGDGILVAHNARFDMAFVDREVQRLTGRRVAAPVLDTVWLARRLLDGRVHRVGLASLAFFFGTAAEPCHRALPDAQATAEILLRLLGLAQERGARTIADVLELAQPRARRLNTKRPLVAAAPTRPGVYRFLDATGQVLYVGRARDLRARLRSYFTSDRQRPSVEAALAALERVDWTATGSELEAAFEELRLIRELQPPANARGKRGRDVWLSRRGGAWSVVDEPTPFGPISGKSLARRAARALDGHESDDVAAALPALRSRMRRLAATQRFEDAARLRDRVEAIARVAERLEALEQLRGRRVCLIVPAREPGFRRVYLVVKGCVAAARTIPPGAGASIEIDAALAQVDAAPEPADASAAAAELAVVAAFLRRPPPELRAVPLTRSAILDGLQEGVAFAA